MLKFCYADIRQGTNDPVEVFEEYKRTLDALESRYPDVVFIHATEPIVQAEGSNGDGPNNIQRAVFNELMRDTYGDGRLWDVAAIQATTLDGRVVQGTHQGQTYHALNPEFASGDGRHINDAGARAIAGPLLELIAEA